MRLGVFSDVHANLPALKAVLDALQFEGVDQMIHLGDAIAIGPYPKECLELMMSRDDLVFLMGNHEDWYVHGLPQPRPDWMTDGELAHQLWTHDQLGPDYREVLEDWPWITYMEIESFKLVFMHYALREGGQRFKPFVKTPSANDLDHLFVTQADFVFYGHSHLASDLQGQSRYLNPGSLGCQKSAIAPYLLIEVTHGSVAIQHRRSAYDDDDLFATFESRRVPERDFIYKAFFGGRYPPAVR